MTLDVWLHCKFKIMFVIDALQLKFFRSQQSIQDVVEVQAWGQRCKEGKASEEGPGWSWREDRWGQEANCCEVWAEPCHVPHWTGTLIFVRKLQILTNCMPLVNFCQWNFIFFNLEQSTVGGNCSWCGPYWAGGLAPSSLQEDGNPLLYCEGEITFGSGEPGIIWFFIACGLEQA